MIKSELVERLPKRYKKDIEKAVEILKNHGCTEVYLFGDYADGTYWENEDMSFAVKGAENKLYFRILGNLIMELSVDAKLVYLDDNTDQSKFVLEREELIRVG